MRPPAAVKVKTPKLDARGLTTAYEFMPVDPETSFLLAYEWYSENRPALLFRDPLDAERQKNFDRGQKSKMLGASGTTWEEKELAFTTGLRKFEQTWASKGLPSVDAAKSVATGTKRAVRVSEILKALNTVFGEWTSYGLTFGAERTKADRKIFVPLAEADAMAERGPVSVVLGEVKEVALGASTSKVRRDDGQYEDEVDGEKFFAILPRLLENAAKFAEAKTPASRSTGPKAPKTSKVFSGSVPASGDVCPFGIFRAGTGKAAVSAALGDGQWHSRAELAAVCVARGVVASQVKVALNEIPARGKGLRVETRNDEVRVVK